jgi:hypothetical protein
VVRGERGERGSVYERDVGLAAFESARWSIGRIGLPMAATHHFRRSAPPPVVASAPRGVQ